jgi:hypothetical protein
VHRLVHAQPLDVGPVEDGAPLPRHLLGSISSGELDVLRVRRRLEPLDQVASGKPTQGITIDHASTQRMR